MRSTQVNLAATLQLRGLKHRLPSQREEPPDRMQECFKVIPTAIDCIAAMLPACNHLPCWHV